MAGPFGSYRTSFIVREAVRIAPARPNIAGGVRGALATALPLLLAAGHPESELVFMSLAGFGAALADKGGAYRTRAQNLLWLALAGAIVTVLGTALAERTTLAVLLTVSVVVAGAFLRLFGAAATALGVAVSVALILALARPLPSFEASLHAGAGFVAGCAWYALLSLVLWPLRAYRPLRLAVGTSLRALSAISASLVAADSAESAQVARRAQLGRAREAIEAARAQLGRARRGRPGPTRRGQQLVALLEAADQLFAALVALEDGLALTSPTGLPAHREWVDRAAELIAEELACLADELEAERVASHELQSARRRHLISEVAASAAGLSEHVPRILVLALERLESVVELARAIDDAGAPARASRNDPSDLSTDASKRSLLRDNLTLDSAVYRHALRLGITMAVAQLAMHALHLEHGYWATLTCLVIMQPHGAATLAKALQRVGGTVLGALLALLVTTFVHDPRAVILLVAVFMAVGMALLPLNYGVFSMFLTPALVLLAESHGGGELALVRVGNTLLGGTAALFGSRLFALREREEVRPLMVRAVAELGGLLDVVAVSRPIQRELGRARRRLGLALLNAEASYQRMLTETDLPAGRSEAVLTLLLYAHRLASGLIALGEAPDTAAHALLVARADGLRSGIDALREALDETSPLPAAGRELQPEGGAAARVDALFEQLAILHGAARRLGAEA